MGQPGETQAKAYLHPSNDAPYPYDFMRSTRLSLLFTFLCCTCVSAVLLAQVPAYYGDVNINATGQALQAALANKITATQTGVPRYTPGVWDALKQTDLDPAGTGSRVVLIYGYSDSDGVSTTDRTRSKEDNGGGATDWNREHVFPKSLGRPNLGTSGPGADVHHLRAADVSRNSRRGSRKFADGSGVSKVTPQGHWYPGDEFKGDVARMVLYMYLRYGSRCLPRNVTVGSRNGRDSDMVDLLLEWNAEDPVSALEDQRNPILQGIQGNRNPFIDNPAFATAIWGGPEAEDRFGGDSGGGALTNTNLTITLDDYPRETSWTLTGSTGQTVASGGNYRTPNTTLNIATPLSPGCYTLTFRDSYGDGMCCAYGNGSFTLRNTANNSIITSGGRFGRSVSRDFCVGETGLRAMVAPSASTIIAPSASFSLYPNPATDHVTIIAPAKASFRLFSTLGRLVHSGLAASGVEVGDLPAGRYTLLITSGDAVEARVLIRR